MLKNGFLYFHSNPATGSCFWRKKNSLLPHLHHGSRWKFGNGSRVRLSYDTWLNNGQIAGRFPHLIFSTDDLVSVLIFGHCWNIPDQLPAEIKKLLQQATTSFKLTASHPDVIEWSFFFFFLLKNHSLSIRYRTHSIKRDMRAWSIFRLESYPMLQPTWSTFAWRLLYRKTPVASWAQSIGVSLASWYSMCLKKENWIIIFFSSSSSSVPMQLCYHLVELVTPNGQLPCSIRFHCNLHLDLFCR